MTAAIGLALTKRSCLRRSNISGADTIALDVVFAVLRTDVARKHLQAAFGSSVCANRLAPKLRHHRADIDNLSFAAFHHLRHDCRRTNERTNKVDVNDLLELLALHLVHGNALDDAGIVDQNVNLPHLGMNLLHQFLHGLLVSHITNVAFRILEASLSVVVIPTLQRLFASTVEDDVLDTCLCKGFCNTETDAVTGSRNPGILAFQGKNVSHVISISLYC